MNTTGQSVFTWKDKSGRGNHVVKNATAYGSAPTFNSTLIYDVHPGLDFTQRAGLISATSSNKSLDITLFMVATIKSPATYGVLWGHFANYSENDNSPNDADICLRQSGTNSILNWHTYHDDLGCAIPYTAGDTYLFAATLQRGTSR